MISLPLILLITQRKVLNIFHAHQLSINSQTNYKNVVIWFIYLISRFVCYLVIRVVWAILDRTMFSNSIQTGRISLSKFLWLSSSSRKQTRGHWIDYNYRKLTANYWKLEQYYLKYFLKLMQDSLTGQDMSKPKWWHHWLHVIIT